MEDYKSIEEWFRLYGDEVYNFLIYYTNRTDVEDMVQEVFIKALRGIRRFKGDSSPKTWLIAIARRVAIDFYRKKKTSEVPFIQGMTQSATHTPEELLELNEDNQELYHAIHTLNQNYRDVLLLRGLKELSVADTAAVLRWSQGKVRVTYHRALKSLKAALEERGMTDARQWL
jgi:RNA polymerase sigma-70 factor, ECF subfamily